MSAFPPLLGVQHVARMSVATCGAACEANPDVAPIARRKTRVTALWRVARRASPRFGASQDARHRAFGASQDARHRAYGSSGLRLLCARKRTQHAHAEFF